MGEGGLSLWALGRRRVMRKGGVGECVWARLGAGEEGITVERMEG
jgi:hypothetical protein